MSDIDETTGEVFDAPPDEISQSIELYKGIAHEPYSEKAAAVILRPLTPETIAIRPEGIIYLPGINYTKLLNEAFGPGAWALHCVRQYYQVKDEAQPGKGGKLYFVGVLFVNGRFAAQATGAHVYNPSNAASNEDDSIESAYTNCLMRCCKHLGIGSELWDKRFINDWIANNAVEIWCEGIGTNNAGTKKPMWRRKDDKPFEYPWKETGIKTAANETPRAQSKPAHRPSNGATKPVTGNDVARNGNSHAATETAARTRTGPETALLQAARKAGWTEMEFDWWLEDKAIFVEEITGKDVASLTKILNAPDTIIGIRDAISKAQGGTQSAADFGEKVTRAPKGEAATQ